MAFRRRIPIPIYRTVVVCEHTSLRHFDGGKFFISQISPKGKRETTYTGQLAADTGQKIVFSFEVHFQRRI